MDLKEARRRFKELYPAGYVTSGKNVGGCTPSRWAVYFGEGRIYEYGGTLRSVLARVLNLSDRERDLLWDIVGRCSNGCPITREYVKYGRCMNCGSRHITFWDK